MNARKSWIFWLHKSRKAVYTDTVAQSVVVCFTKSLNSDRCPSIVEPAVKKKTIVKDWWRGELSKKNHKGCPKPSNLSALANVHHVRELLKMQKRQMIQRKKDPNN